MKKYAIVTGATSGIGKSFATSFAKMGLNLVITGRREELLQSIATDLSSKYGVTVDVEVGDLADRDYVTALCEKMKSVGAIEYLVNNAGYGNRDSFFNGVFKEQEKMLEVHIYALTQLVHVAGNIMKEQKFGNIINTSSLASFFPIPTGEFYCSTKAFINIFTESVFIGLRKYNIRVQCLCPGFTYTDFHRKLNIDDSKRVDRLLIKWMSADEVVRISLKNLQKKDKVIVVPGFFNQILYLSSYIIPKRLYYKFATSSVKIPGKKESE